MGVLLLPLAHEKIRIVLVYRQTFIIAPVEDLTL